MTLKQICTFLMEYILRTEVTAKKYEPVFTSFIIDSHSSIVTDILKFYKLL